MDSGAGLGEPAAHISSARHAHQLYVPEDVPSPLPPPQQTRVAVWILALDENGLCA